MAKKTLVCKSVKHHASSIKASDLFKEGKRYKVNINRVLGAVAGTVADKTGNTWTLYRNPTEGSGYHCAIAEFFE